MFKKSVIRKTSQWWKFILAVLALIIGSVAPIFESSGMSWTTGTVLAIVGYGLGVAFISCPACHVRWFWKALIHSELYGPVMTRPVCPVCQQDFDSDKRDRSES